VRKKFDIFFAFLHFIFDKKLLFLQKLSLLLYGSPDQSGKPFEVELHFF
jgi:hypothetical protein